MIRFCGLAAQQFKYIYEYRKKDTLNFFAEQFKYIYEYQKKDIGFEKPLGGGMHWGYGMEIL